MLGSNDNFPLGQKDLFSRGYVPVSFKDLFTLFGREKYPSEILLDHFFPKHPW